MAPKSKSRLSPTEETAASDNERVALEDDTDASIHPRLASESDDQTPPPKRRTRARHDMLPGERKVKSYSVSQLELIGLGGVGFLSTVCFSLGGTYLTRAYGISRDLIFAKTAKDFPAEIIARWDESMSNFTVIGYTLLVVGALIFLGGGAAVWSVIRSTTHDE